MSYAPSDLALVPFVSVENMMKIVHQIGIERFLSDLAAHIEEDFRRWPSFDRRRASPPHSREGVIELMPTSDGIAYGFKYVNGHPKNTKEGRQTVTAFGVMAEVDTGYPVLIAEMTILTALRTAAMSALAAKYLAPEHSRTMTLIGNGAQSEFQALAFHALVGVDRLRLYDIDPAASERCARNLARARLRHPDLPDGEEAVEGADIITTCTADKQYATILTDNMVGTGQHINAVGGDCPARQSCTRTSCCALTSSLSIRRSPVEGEIQQLKEDHPVAELWEVMIGATPGRQSPGQITLFDSVGFAVEDFSALRYLRGLLPETERYDMLDLLADPDDPRDLFGMLMRAAP